MKNSANKSPNKSWEKTKVQNLVRHKSGRYYARTFGNNKEIWKSLRTDHFSVAKARLAEFLLADRQDEPTTRHYWKQVFTSLLKVGRDLRSEKCAGSRKPVARSGRAGFAGWHHQRATTTRLLASDVCSTWQLKRASFTATQQPSWSDCGASEATHAPESQLVEAVEQAGAWCSRDCADFLRGLALTGCRKGEAAEIRWSDLAFAAGEIVVRGDPETGTKNWTVGRVSMIPDARALFGRMRSKRVEESPNEEVFRVERGAEDNRQRSTQARHSTHHAPRSAASFRNRRNRHPDHLPLA